LGVPAALLKRSPISPSGFSDGYQFGSLTVLLFVLLGSLFLLVPLDPGYQVLEVGWT
jgi:hypothetical protein